MASSVIPFPVAAAPRSRLPLSSSQAAVCIMPACDQEGRPEPPLLNARRGSRNTSAATCSPRPTRTFTNTSSRTQDHADRIVLQVEQEIAARVQREALQREGIRMHRIRRMPALAVAYVPPQATAVGLRQRLLDALLFFGRPA